MADGVVEYQLESRAEILDEDKILVAAAREDIEAAGRLYDKYYNDIHEYIYHCTFDSAASEDMTSNVFLSAFRHLGRYQWRQIPFRAWLYRIATNEVRMHWRRKKCTASMIKQEQSGELARSEPSGSDRIAAEEECRLLHKALLKLRLKYRTVIILRYFEDRAISEICEITGSKEGTVKSRLHRGLARLQDILVRWGVIAE